MTFRSSPPAGDAPADHRPVHMVSSPELQRNPAQVQELARSRDVILTHYGHPRSVLMSYERYQSLLTAAGLETEDMPVLEIFVPAPGSAAERLIARGSAIVGAPRTGTRQPDDDRWTVYYEGNTIGASNVVSFHDKLQIAAGRLVHRYPTVAMASFPAEDLIHVGRYDVDRQVILTITDAQALEVWTSGPAEELIGERCDPGAYAWGADTPPARLAAAENGGRVISHTGGLFIMQSRAGQVILLRAGDQKARIFDHDDPGLLPHIQHLRQQSPETLRRLLGRHATAAALSA